LIAVLNEKAFVPLQLSVVLVVLEYFKIKIKEN